jgi:hypothetical protein
VYKSRHGPSLGEPDWQLNKSTKRPKRQAGKGREGKERKPGSCFSSSRARQPAASRSCSRSTDHGRPGRRAVRRGAPMAGGDVRPEAHVHSRQAGRQARRGHARKKAKSERGGVARHDGCLVPARPGRVTRKATTLA